MKIYTDKKEYSSITILFKMTLLCDINTNEVFFIKVTIHNVSIKNVSIPRSQRNSLNLLSLVQAN